jgi:hypothetical protein
MVKIKVRIVWSESGADIQNGEENGFTLPARTNLSMELPFSGPKPAGTIETTTLDCTYVCLDCGYRDGDLESYHKHQREKHGVAI